MCIRDRTNSAYAATGMENKGTAGYFAGINTSPSTIVDKIAFPGDTKTTLSTGLSVASYYSAGFSDANI